MHMHEKNPLRVDNIGLCTDGIKDFCSMINQKNSFNHGARQGKDCEENRYLPNWMKTSSRTGIIIWSR